MQRSEHHFVFRRCVRLVGHLAFAAVAGLLTFASARAQVSGGATISRPVRPQANAQANVQIPAAVKLAGSPTPHPDKSRATAAFEAGHRAEQARDWKTAYADYSKAAGFDPSNRQYSMLKEHARFQTVQGILDAAERQELAGNNASARALILQAIAIDPNFEVARERLAALAPDTPQIDSPQIEQKSGTRLAGLPRLSPKPGAHDFDYRGTTRGAYEEIGRQFGVTMVFDGDLQDRSVRFRAPNVDYETAVMVLSRQTRTFTRVADEHTLFVTDDTAQKERDYAPEIEKTIVLPASVTSDEMNETVRMIREMTGISRTQLNTASHTLTVRSTEQNVALAQAILQQVEQPRGEVILDIEILQVNRDSARQLGVMPPSSVTAFTLSQNQIQELQSAQNSGTLLQELQTIFGSVSGLGASTGGASSALLPLIAVGGGKTIFLATVPGATANFSQTLSSVRSAQRVLLRAQDGKAATFFVGDRYPIDLATLSSDLSGASTGLSSALTAALLSGLSLPRTDYTVGAAPRAVAVADVNGDGFQDIVVANKTDGTISILLGKGDGTFGTQIPISMPAGAVTPAPSAVALGDFNADGHVDIAVADSANNSVAIFLGNGDGTFTQPVSYPTGTEPVALVAQDFDGDGEADLAVVNQGDGSTASTVSILLGNKTNRKQNGTFGAKTDYPVDVAPSAIASTDFDGDGVADLAVANHGDASGNGGNSVSILLGNSDGTFKPKTDFATGNGPAGIATADFNGDGHPDLAVTNQADSTVSILLGNGNGTFVAHTDYASGSGSAGILAADFTGEGNPDLAVADQTGNTVDILIGNGDGTLNVPIPLPTGNGPVAVAAADVNGDGTLDVIAANQSSNSVTVTLNTLQSSLGNSSSTQVAYPSAEYVDLGLKVKATPRLHGDDEVTLQLEFDLKSLAGSSINGIPILTNRTIEQTVRLRENETSVLSGLLQTNQSNAVAGLPWTSTTPGVGLLTGENTADSQETEMLIIVTPRALRLPPRNAPAIYAGRGEPATPPSPVLEAPPSTPVPQPGPGQPPGQQPGAQPGIQPGAPTGLPPGVQPGQLPPGTVPPRPGLPQQ